MVFPAGDARFRLARAFGLIRRAWSSLRIRGWNATLRRTVRRACLMLRPRPPAPAPWLPPSAPFAPFVLPHIAGSTPDASIVIPVYGQFNHTLACLRALAAHPPTAAVEVIVVDDGSTDTTPELLPQIEGLRYHRRAQNAGFIASCNDGAALARGQMLVFLNNDTVPQPGWLDALLATFREWPEAGLVGAQLVYPDGRLQEAGGVVFSDGSAWSFGRFESPDDPRYCYLRDVDYVSGAAIAIPRNVFSQIGGFDSRYAPAYYEDVDLAFAVRSAGKRVLYQPAARVVHDEGATSGTDIEKGVKAFQARNREIFAAHRAETLRGRPQSNVEPTQRTLIEGRREILVVDESVPRPDRDSGSLRLVHLMRTLLEEGVHVAFVPADGLHGGNYTSSLQAMGVEVWHAPWLVSLPAWLRSHARRFEIVMLCRHYVASDLLPLLRRHAPDARVLFDSVDLHYLREMRAADIQGDDSLSAIAARTRKRELAVIRQSDLTLVVSETERAVLALDAPEAHVEVLSNLHRIPEGGRPWAHRRDIVFVGGFHHPPNLDALQWFIVSVWPLVHERLPEVAFHCIGSDPPPQVAALDGRQGVRVHGYVPDIESYMDGCRVAVAPLRYGAGVKGKINLSMAHAQPVVATTCAAEGMHLRHEHDALIADDPQAFADAVVRLYNDEPLWRQLSKNGRDNVIRHFSIDAARDVIRRLFVTWAHEPDT